MSYIDPALLESIGIYGNEQQNFAGTIPGAQVGNPASVAPVLPGYMTPMSGAAIVSKFMASVGLEMNSDLANYFDYLRTNYGSDLTGFENQLAADALDIVTPLGKAINTKYPEIKVRRDMGSPINIGDAIDYRDTVTQLMREYGIPPGFYDDPNDFVSMHQNHISPLELQHRIVQGYNAAMQADPGVREQLATLYGVDTGQLAAYYLDPTRSQDILQKQLAASQTGAGARMGGYQLSSAEAERAAGMGITESQAAERFGTLTNSAQLFTGLAGQEGTEPVIGREMQVNAALGEQSAQEQLDRRARARRAVFGAGGGFAAGQQGIAGLGAATTG